MRTAGRGCRDHRRFGARARVGDFAGFTDPDHTVLILDETYDFVAGPVSVALPSERRDARWQRRRDVRARVDRVGADVVTAPLASSSLQAPRPVRVVRRELPALGLVDVREAGANWSMWPTALSAKS